MKASELSQKIDYPSFPEFRDFGIDMTKLDAALILKLQDLRSRTGIPVTPSPVIAGWYREGGSTTSRHYAVNRLSDAGDVFPARGKIMDFWLACVIDPHIGGVGFYMDTNGPDGRFWPMVHIDMRPQKALWVRHEGRYFTAGHRFWQTIKGGIAYDAGS